MIVVDSSVWIANSRDLDTAATRRLRHIAREQTIIVGDVVLLEVLQGARSEKEAAAFLNFFRQFKTVSMLSPELAVRAAANYRLLRRRGITVRKPPDVIIGTFCIERGYALLHDDRDFLPMVEHLGLRLA